MGLLNQFAAWMDQVLPDKGAVALAIGAGSAIIDNVPLVAAAQGMYPMDDVAGGIMGQDGYFGSFWPMLRVPEVLC